MKGTTIAIAGAGAIVLYMVTSSASRAANAVKDMKAEVTMPTDISVSDLVVKLPIQVKILNYHNVSIPIDTLVVTAEYEDNGKWVEFAHNTPAFGQWQIKPAAVTNFNVELRAPLAGLLFDMFTIVAGKVQKTGKRRIRINAIPTVLGQRIEPITNIYAV